MRREHRGGVYPRGKSLLFTRTCDLPLLLRPWPQTVFTLLFTPTSAQKRGGTTETLPPLLGLANRGDASVLASFLGQTLDKSPYPPYHNSKTWGFAGGSEERIEMRINEQEGFLKSLNCLKE